MTDPTFIGTPSGAPPQYTFIVPYNRVSPVHIPRRDLVLGATDSLSLRVSIIEDDSPSAMALDLTGGIGGPALRFVVWRDGPHYWWDYGAPVPIAPEVLWTGGGTVDPDVLGTFDIAMPQATMALWPRRCGFWLFLDWDGGLQSELLAQGRLHVTRTVGAPLTTATVITTDIPPVQPITTD